MGFNEITSEMSPRELQIIEITECDPVTPYVALLLVGDNDKRIPTEIMMREIIATHAL